MANHVEYDSKQKRMIHQLMAAVFSRDELDQFAASNFGPVFNRFTPEMDNNARIRQLIEYCAQHNQLGRLVDRIQQAKPESYQAFVQRVKKGTGELGQPESAPLTPAQPAPPAPLTPFSPEQELQRIQHILNQALTNRYRIDDVLDTSGLGAVFKSYDTKTELEVAIKVIDLNRVRQPALRERARQEARTAMKLDHPGVVQVFDFGEAGSLLYIIMELIPGSNLAQVRRPFEAIDRRTTLPQILELVRQLCLTVDYLHQQGVLHPSLVPDNIMLRPNGASQGIAWQPVLINFALLRPHRETLATQTIEVDQLTYQVSPELLLGHVTDVRTDVYSLGILLYDLVVGQPPFRPQNITEAVRLHVEVPPAPPRSTNPNVPEIVNRVILKALAKDPAERYLTAKGLAQALGDCLEEVVPAARPPLAPPRVPESTGPAEVTIRMAETRPLVIAPGATLSIRFILRNEGGQGDHCQVKVQGVPSNWLSVSPAATTLSPGETQEVILTIQPPLSTLSRAGRYTLTIQVMSEHGPEKGGEVQQVLTVTTYARVTTSLWPEEFSPDQAVQVNIENQGNATDTFTVRPRLDRGLICEPEQAQLQIAPGEIGTAEFRVVPVRKRWIGKTFTQTISFQISSSQGVGEGRSGQLITQGVIAPEWILAVILAIAVLCCAFFMIYPAIVAPPTPTSFPSPTFTPIPTVASTLVPTVVTPTPVPPTFTPTLPSTPIPTAVPVTAVPVATLTPTPTPTLTPQPSQPPRAVIFGPNTTQVGQNITFDGRSSQAGNSSIVSYTWDFGDGGRASGDIVSHVYNVAGNYGVTLTVIDQNNQSNSTSLGIQVTQ
ncbi:MAG: protein kinase [Anaerolineae bacterium]|nr:protein kinase [Anaerolineae bacterium]